jgi:hypothetical protein
MRRERSLATRAQTQESVARLERGRELSKGRLREEEEEKRESSWTKHAVNPVYTLNGAGKAKRSGADRSVLLFAGRSLLKNHD